MRLKELRLRQNKQQGEVAKDLNMSQTGYSHYETGRTQPNIEMIIKLADYFHVTIDNLLEHDVPYLMDKSEFTKQQQEVIDQITELNDTQCILVKTYILGMQSAEQDKKQNLQKIKE